MCKSMGTAVAGLLLLAGLNPCYGITYASPTALICAGDESGAEAGNLMLVFSGRAISGFVGQDLSTPFVGRTHDAVRVPTLEVSQDKTGRLVAADKIESYTGVYYLGFEGNKLEITKIDVVEPAEGMAFVEGSDRQGAPVFRLSSCEVHS